MVDADPTLLPDPPFDRAGRDACRTPMQWDPTRAGGFTRGTPWLPAVDPAIRNVAGQSSDPGSLLALYRTLIAARTASPALSRGTHRSIFGVAHEVLAWLRQADDERILVVLNVGDEGRDCDLDPARLGAASGDVVVATSERTGHLALAGLHLRPLEGVALRLG